MIHTTKPTNTSGQVAIVILLIMVVLLTVGLSLASRTTQELFLSQQESESARVFNAAEVGVEDALSQDFDLITGTVTLNPDTVADVTTQTTISPSSTLETQLVEGAAVHLNLQNYNGNFTINWARETTCNADAANNPGAASLLVSIYFEEAGVTKVTHEVLTPCTRTPDDQFTLVNTAGTNGYYRQRSISVPPTMGGTTLFARVRAVYADTALRVTGTGLPTQFFTIRSAANTQVGEESRTVEVGRTLSGAPSFMDYAVYSGAGITQDTP